MCLAGLLSLLSLRFTHLGISFIILPIWDSVFILLLQSRNSSSSTAYFNVNKPHDDLEWASLSLSTHLITPLFSWRSLRSQLSLQLSLYLNPNRICQSLTTLEDTGSQHSSVPTLGYPHPPQLTYFCYHLSLYAHGSSRVPLRGSICKREERGRCRVER